MQLVNLATVYNKNGQTKQHSIQNEEGRVKFGKTGHQQIAKIKMLKIKSRFVDAIWNFFIY